VTHNKKSGETTGDRCHDFFKYFRQKKWGKWRFRP
jgi:hypothetical protein